MLLDITNTFYIIGIVVVVVLILAGIIMTFVKKPNNQKDNISEKNTSLFQENNYKKNNKSYANKWVVVKKGIQEYYVFLFDSESKTILESEMFASILGANNAIASISKLVNGDFYKVNRTFDKKIVCLFKNERGRTIAFSNQFENYNELERGILLIKSTISVATKEETVIKDLSIVDYKIIHNYIPNRKDVNWKIVKTEKNLIGILYDDDNNEVIMTEEFSKKSEVKNAISIIKRSFNEGKIIITKDFSNLYFYKIRNAAKLSVATSKPFENYEKCEEAVKDLIKII